MTTLRPFRFGVLGDVPADEWIAHAARAEALGYDVLSVGEHVITNLAPIPALAAAAAATSTIRLGTATLANDLRNPVMLARDIATIDALSGGRMEFGLGSGFLHLDYTQTGISLDAPGTRVDRLVEAIRLIKAAFSGDSIDHFGAHYEVHGLSLSPKPVQQPALPMLLGGGGPRMPTARSTSTRRFHWSARARWGRDARRVLGHPDRPALLRSLARFGSRCTRRGSQRKSGRLRRQRQPDEAAW